MRLLTAIPARDWTMLPQRQRIAASLSEWQGLQDPATGEVYYMSHATGASLWERRNETLRSEAELRKFVVPQLDGEYRGEV